MDSPFEGVGMNSRNHHMFSSFSHYLVTTVGGVDETSGDHVQLRPAAGGALDVAAARVSIDTVGPMENLLVSSVLLVLGTKGWEMMIQLL